VVFGWQFRPVLGADYVQPGPRQVFAQLALPTGLREDFEPQVWIQTRWREYDPKRRVVGAVYRGSCSVVRDPNPLSVLNPFTVDDVHMDDMGGGVLRLTAQGNFFSSGFSALIGHNAITPTTLTEIRFRCSRTPPICCAAAASI
ncbi:MAG: hypothetical protein JOZ62_23155, partial [Acidobacteriaceae bacterium]|nr:hypothetical protein [Acidobacteriaceae bacterium]